jgi:hypothetical protein
MDALAHIIPPGTGKVLSSAFAQLLNFLVEFAVIITSSIPSPTISDHPSSLKPLVASLNPLKNQSAT